MAMFKREKKLDLPSPPDKFSDISKPDFEEDFPKYNQTINFDEDKIEEKPSVSNINMPSSLGSMPSSFTAQRMEEHYEKKPLFIKVDKYEEAIHVLNSVKDKLNEASNILNELRQIRRDEDSQLEGWTDHLNMVKEKLTDIDKILFE